MSQSIELSKTMKSDPETRRNPFEKLNKSVHKSISDQIKSDIFGIIVLPTLIKVLRSQIITSPKTAAITPQIGGQTSVSVNSTHHSSALTSHASVMIATTAADNAKVRKSIEKNYAKLCCSKHVTQTILQSYLNTYDCNYAKSIDNALCNGVSCQMGVVTKSMLDSDEWSVFATRNISELTSFNGHSKEALYRIRFELLSAVNSNTSEIYTELCAMKAQHSSFQKLCFPTSFKIGKLSYVLGNDSNRGSCYLSLNENIIIEIELHSSCDTVLDGINGTAVVGACGLSYASQSVASQIKAMAKRVRFQRELKHTNSKFALLDTIDDSDTQTSVGSIVPCILLRLNSDGSTDAINQSLIRIYVRRSVDIRNRFRINGSIVDQMDTNLVSSSASSTTSSIPLFATDGGSVATLSSSNLLSLPTLAREHTSAFSASTAALSIPPPTNPHPQTQSQLPLLLPPPQTPTRLPLLIQPQSTTLSSVDPRHCIPAQHSVFNNAASVYMPQYVGTTNNASLHRSPLIIATHPQRQLRQHSSPTILHQMTPFTATQPSSLLTGIQSMTPSMTGPSQQRYILITSPAVVTQTTTRTTLPSIPSFITPVLNRTNPPIHMERRNADGSAIQPQSVPSFITSIQPPEHKRRRL